MLGGSASNSETRYTSSDHRVGVSPGRQLGATYEKGNYDLLLSIWLN